VDAVFIEEPPNPTMPQPAFLLRQQRGNTFIISLYEQLENWIERGLFGAQKMGAEGA
jgi:hypothetical protein